ncbi:MAG: polysaccharide pyruvyl transferase family protein [Microbacterium gubbeenense]|uniref:polysaccharide pyruvyl transferase family protein n=1 Tax=Microbacterium gubbeenense TaxID=159896 RepID=UPI003F977721
MINERDQQELEKVRAQTLSVLKQVLGDAQEVVILDAPNQRNIGDSLIWEGELAYLRELGIRIVYVTDIRGYDARDVRRRLPRDGVVLLHGGGNFGDLWEGHQKLRERVVRDLPEYKIVQLSQSIYFAREERAVQANDVLSGHDDFTVLIRDSLSLERAAQQLPGINVVFCPDMALGYSPDPELFDGSGQASPEALVIARADHESASGLSAVNADWLQGRDFLMTDWAEVAGKSSAWKRARRLAWLDWQMKRVRRKTGIPIPILPATSMFRALEVINRRNVEDAILLYAGRKGIVVDRLHAHVLASLMGIENVLLDNNYKKLGGVFDDYTGRLSTATYAIGLDNARNALVEVLAR